jgi:two-component system, NarL family, sensor histidine kinase UhpB
MSTLTDRERVAVRRDLIIVALITLTVGVLSAGLEVSEAFFAGTRRWEHLQIDELPAVLLVLAASLIWFSWRRYSEARVALTRRRLAEEQLGRFASDNRRLAQQYMQVQEAERKTLARELHDELGQYLNAIKTDAVFIQDKTADSSPGVSKASAAIIRHADHVHAVVRDLIRQLRPIGLDELGLRAALEHYLDSCRQRLSHLQIDVSLEGDLDTLDERISLTIYRLIQEGMTNISRHAEARRVELHVARETGSEGRNEDSVVVTLIDDGRGADLSEGKLGLGLIGMRERVEMLGGQLRISTAAGQGFRILVRIPAAGLAPNR